MTRQRASAEASADTTEQNPGPIPSTPEIPATPASSKRPRALTDGTTPHPAEKRRNVAAPNPKRQPRKAKGDGLTPTTDDVPFPIATSPTDSPTPSKGHAYSTRIGNELHPATARGLGKKTQQEISAAKAAKAQEADQREAERLEEEDAAARQAQLAAATTAAVLDKQRELAATKRRALEADATNAFARLDLKATNARKKPGNPRNLHPRRTENPPPRREENNILQPDDDQHSAGEPGGFYSHMTADDLAWMARYGPGGTGRSGSGEEGGDQDSSEVDGKSNADVEEEEGSESEDGIDYIALGLDNGFEVDGEDDEVQKPKRKKSEKKVSAQKLTEAQKRHARVTRIHNDVLAHRSQPSSTTNSARGQKSGPSSSKTSRTSTGTEFSLSRLAFYYEQMRAWRSRCSGREGFRVEEQSWEKSSAATSELEPRDQDSNLTVVPAKPDNHGVQPRTWIPRSRVLSKCYLSGFKPRSAISSSQLCFTYIWGSAMIGNPWDLDAVSADDNPLETIVKLIVRYLDLEDDEYDEEEDLPMLVSACRTMLHNWHRMFFTATINMLTTEFKGKSAPEVIRFVDKALHAEGAAYWKEPELESGLFESKYIILVMHEHIKICKGSVFKEILVPKPKFMRPEGALTLTIAAVQAGFERFRTGKFVKGEAFSQTNCKKDGNWDAHARSVKNLSENRIALIMSQAEAWQAGGSPAVGSSRRSTAHVLQSRGSSPPVYSD
ncbi:hypothetical protein EIP91_010847 [Steccherinum ochraceum]|uniref:Uncharacterized protein n=1 Tax=Steccherinum ochraceum TaxID=92696 RepID=A0A4R0RC40_9APHY|nr:hypothetical protein EIP91_010847 [Steccherinum ochraceum]